jgi:hypothetical protein
MLNKKIIGFGLVMLAGISNAESQHQGHTDGMKMDHHSMNTVSADEKTITEATNLLESGTDPFAVIQETISKLEANKNTDWSKVNIEALRKHLVEMEDATLNVTLKQVNVKNGFAAMIFPQTNRAVKSLFNLLKNHPEQMEKETGWVMVVNRVDDHFEITVTTKNDKEIDKIRGLGYIGVIAYGDHHKKHHWSMASGEEVHGHHNKKH